MDLLLKDLLLCLALAAPGQPTEKPLAPPPVEVEIEGWYTAVGQAQGGEGYKGVVLIRRHHTGYRLHWLLEGGSRADGVAIREGNVLSVGVTPILCYRFVITRDAGGKAKLTGQFLGGGGDHGDETLTWLRASEKGP